jgi:hypothetical protein
MQLCGGIEHSVLHMIYIIRKLLRTSLIEVRCGCALGSKTLVQFHYGTANLRGKLHDSGSGVGLCHIWWIGGKQQQN